MPETLAPAAAGCQTRRPAIRPSDSRELRLDEVIGVARRTRRHFSSSWTRLVATAAVAAALLGLALAKLAWVRRNVPGLLSSRAALVLLAQAALVLAVPVAAAHLAWARRFSPRALWLFWWATLVLPFAPRLLGEETRDAGDGGPRWGRATWTWIPTALASATRREPAPGRAAGGPVSHDEATSEGRRSRADRAELADHRPRRLRSRGQSRRRGLTTSSARGRPRRRRGRRPATAGRRRCARRRRALRPSGRSRGASCRRHRHRSRE